jgi:N4-(beta-N-acetylglucosaminyl)-L-asparaginase
MTEFSRRKLFQSSLAAGAAAIVGRLFSAMPAAGQAGGAAARQASTTTTAPAASGATGTLPVIISAANGVHWLPLGMDILQKGGDTLDAVLAVVTKVEDDPEDTSVGYGGLPNEEGVVELDASVMHGPTRRAGAVGALQQIKNPSLVARAVMERTDHVFLVGEGARRYAVDEGFQPIDLMTVKSRTAWLAWKASVEPNWRPGLDSPEWKEKLSKLLDTPEKIEWTGWLEQVVAHPPTGTINCLAANAKHEISGTTTTSGLAWKIPGRVGDSPIIGAGLYVDGDVGGVGSTGRGEENIRIAGGHTVVEMMRRGMSPTDACLETLHRVVRNYSFDESRLRRFHLVYYALNKEGAYGSASLWKGTTEGKVFHYAVDDGAGAKLLPCTPLFDGVTPDY